MLDQLVESKSNTTENKRRSEFMITVLVIAILAVVGAWTKSLFAHDYGMGGDDLAVPTLVAPVPVEDEPPPKPKEQQKQPDADVRKELIQSMDVTPKVPEKISVVQNTVKAVRPDRLTVVGNTESDTGTKLDPGNGRVVESQGNGGLSDSTATTTTADDAPPPPKKVVPRTVSGGVLNGKATSLPKPAYPPAARAVRAGGSVAVQVLIDESGRVVSASAVSGHPLLRAAAVSAAQGARFSPTLLSGQPVKVSGVITYNFVP
jgi:protein TonB